VRLQWASRTGQRRAGRQEWRAFSNVRR